MGTPDFAVPALERIAANDAGTIELVVTQPDRRAGRGRKMVSPAVKVASDRLALPVLQTATLRNADVRQRIINAEPDLIIVAAFGMILGRWVLELPTHGCVNLHASLLPKYRGANPIAAAIACGEPETGVSLMRMDRGLDTGPVYATTTLSIRPDDTTETLTPRLADAAAELLEGQLSALLTGQMEAEPQGRGATLTRPMTKDDGWLDFSRPAADLERQVRAMWPWPRAWTTTASGERIQVHAAGLGPQVSESPGTVVHDGRHVFVAAGEGALRLLRIQLPGGRPIEAPALAQLPSLAGASLLGAVDKPDSLNPLVVSGEA